MLWRDNFDDYGEIVREDSTKGHSEDDHDLPMFDFGVTQDEEFMPHGQGHV